MTTREIEQAASPKEQVEILKEELAAAQQKQLEAEAELATKQAEVNAFRMHCRLQLDDLVEQLLELRTEKQSLLTRLELLKQAEDLGIPYHDDDPFWQGIEDIAEEPEEEILLPTDVPRDRAAEKRIYRELARRFHPDLASTVAESAYRTSMMSMVNTAYSGGDVQALYDLAGEIDPEVRAEIDSIQVAEVRQLRRQIYACRRRRRKAQRRMQLMLDENTARLWRRAQHLESADEDWWSAVREDITRVMIKLDKDVDQLRVQLAMVEPLDAVEE